MPAGEISFTAAIGRDKRLDPSEYPEIMGVTGRYAGRGLVAQAGFTEPRCGLLCCSRPEWLSCSCTQMLRELHSTRLGTFHLVLRAERAEQRAWHDSNDAAHEAYPKLCAFPARWVEGELLQFAEGSPVTQGARLGFMWASPGQRRFLVRARHCYFFPDFCRQAAIVECAFGAVLHVYMLCRSGHAHCLTRVRPMMHCHTQQQPMHFGAEQVLLHRVGLDEDD